MWTLFAFGPALFAGLASVPAICGGKDTLCYSREIY